MQKKSSFAEFSSTLSKRSGAHGDGVRRDGVCFLDIAMAEHGHIRPGLPGERVLACGYGLALGWLRIFTGGLGWPVLAHVAADATIFALVMRSGVL